MKRWLLGTLAFLAISSPAFAEEETYELKGLTVGAQISNATGTLAFFGAGAGVSGVARYWDKYFGFDTAIGLSTSSLEAGGADSDVTSFEINGGPLLGFQKGAAKPYIRVGFGYSSFDSDGGFDTHQVFVNPTIGVDIQASRHVVIGLSVLSIRYLLDSEIDVSGFGAGTDIDGTTISFLNGFSIGYLF